MCVHIFTDVSQHRHITCCLTKMGHCLLSISNLESVYSVLGLPPPRGCYSHFTPRWCVWWCVELSECHQMLEVSHTNTNQLVECAGCVSRGRVWGVFEGVSGAGLGCIWGVLPSIKICHYMSSVCVVCYVCRW